MATKSRAEDLAIDRSILRQEFLDHPGRYQFFQAVRLLHRLFPERGSVGLYVPPQREVVRFFANNSLVFPPGQIHSLQWEDGGQPKMMVNFMGLTGPLGLLPIWYTELIRQRIRLKDHALEDFLDIFNHRAVSLFYQAWEKYRGYVAYERNERDRLSRCVLSFVGLDTPGLQKRQTPVKDEVFAFYCGLFSTQTRSAAALEQIVSDFFNVPAEVTQFVGVWRGLATSDRCRMEASVQYSDQLGLGAIAGDEIWDRQSRARIKLGPMTAQQYRAFLPVGDAWESLRAITRFFTNGEIEFEVQLVLKRDEVPRCGLNPSADDAPLLGWISWIKSGDTFGRDPGDTVLLLN
jgi:type VI secretion system protein ImpH